MTSRKKIVGYTRVSTNEQKKKGYGIEIQIKDIRKFAKENSLQIDHIFKDEAVSGTEENREGLNSMLSLCKKDKIKAIIFPSTERTARSVRISENLYYKLNKYNVRIYFADMPYYDPDNHGDVMLRQIKEVIAEGNRNAIIERLKKGREQRIIKGRPAGGNVPYGYYRNREQKKLLINKDEAEIIQNIFDQHTIEKNSRQIADLLNSQGYSRRNHTPWTQRQVYSILNRKKLYQDGIIKYGTAKGEDKTLIILKTRKIE